MTNFFDLEILIFPLNFFVFLNFIFGIYSITNIIVRYKSLELNLINFYLLNFVIFGSYVSLINYLIFFNITFLKTFIYFTFFIFFILNIKNLKKLNFFLVKKKIDINIKVIFFFILIYFIISSLPLSDGDSLSYHSSFGAYILRYNSIEWLKTSYLIHPDFLVSGFTEIYNFIGLTLFNENFGSYLNFFSLLLIIYFFYEFFKNNKNTSFIILTIVSSPILLPMIFAQKIYILPSFVLALIFFKIYNEKKNKTLDYILIISSLMIILSFKVSFLYSVIIAILFLVYKNNQNFIRIGLLCFPLFLIFFGSILFKNIFFHSDILPPFTGQIFGTNSSYLNLTAEFLKNYDVDLNFINLVALPFLFIIPHYGQGGSIFLSLPNIGKIFGIQFYNFLLIKNFYNREFIIFLFIIFFSVVFTGNISTRWFLFLFFLLQMFVCLANIEIKKILKHIFYFQTFVFGVALVGFCIYSAPTLFSSFYKDSYLTKHANGYDFIKKINKLKKDNNFTEKEKILFSHRSHYWENNNHLNYANEWLRLVNIKENFMSLNKEFLQILKGKKIKILVTREVKNINIVVNNSFKKKCKILHGKFSSNHATRNPFFSGKKNYSWFNFGKHDFLECLK